MREDLLVSVAKAGLEAANHRPLQTPTATAQQSIFCLRDQALFRESKEDLEKQPLLEEFNTVIRAKSLQFRWVSTFQQVCAST